MLSSYLRFVGPSLRPAFKFHDSPDFISDGVSVQADLDRRRDANGQLYALWIADHLNLLAVAFVNYDFLQVSRQFRYVVDDSIGGQVVSQVLRRLDIPQFPISESNPAARLRGLRAIVQARSAVVLAVDGGGPYFEVGTGIGNLARTLRIPIVPCCAVASRPLPIPNRRVRITLPRLSSTIQIQFGQPIEPVESGSVLVAHRLRDALNRLRGSICDEVVVTKRKTL